MVDKDSNICSTSYSPGESDLDGTAIYRVALGQGQRPDSWQRDLMEHEWPQVLIAPTGSGKTAAVSLGWAVHRLRSPQTTFRRLIWCLPMRTLVDQTAKAIKDWFGRLAEATKGADRLPGPEDVHVLMGGLESGRWFVRPERPAVIIGTQDMLLSRALMRGYAASRANWPMEFALLHDDAQWVFDEVQLMQTGRATSAQLEAFRRQEAARTSSALRSRGNPSRSLWISATLDPKWLKTVDHEKPSLDAVLRINPNMAEDNRLTRLVRAKKTISRSDVVLDSSKSDEVKRYISELAKSVVDAHRVDRMTLVIVNRVKRAQDLFSAIEGLLQKRESPPELVLVHSRFRLADRKREMAKIANGSSKNVVVVATQAVEAGVDISAAVLITELAPWSSMVQRFGRVNRYAELGDGGDIHWIDLLGDVIEDKIKSELSLPYSTEELQTAREQLSSLSDAASVNLKSPDMIEPSRRVIRRKDLDDLFDTDPDLTGFDVDISHYVRDSEDTDVRIFWRDTQQDSESRETPLRARAEELCAAPIAQVRDWLKKVRKIVKDSRKKSDCPSTFVFVRDPQWRKNDEALIGWRPFRDAPWPGMTLLVDRNAGGYDKCIGFTGDPKHIPEPIADSQDRVDPNNPAKGADEESLNEDPRSAIGIPVPLTEHLNHVVAEAEELCETLEIVPEIRAAIVRAARWHDLGKAHDVFQDTMRRGFPESAAKNGFWAKTVKGGLHHGRAFFRHELASALAFLDHEKWEREADLVAYLIAAHHGKVRMNLRALPQEEMPTGEGMGPRYVRGIWEGDQLPELDLGEGERWGGGPLSLSIMEFGWDEDTRESWTERTRNLLERFGPFQLAWMETIVRLADWRASAKEQMGNDGVA